MLGTRLHRMEPAHNPGFRCYGARGEAMALSSLQQNDGAPHGPAE
jgi:hypothetical protein